MFVVNDVRSLIEGNYIMVVPNSIFFMSSRLKVPEKVRANYYVAIGQWGNMFFI